MKVLRSFLGWLWQGKWRLVGGVVLFFLGAGVQAVLPQEYALWRTTQDTPVLCMTTSLDVSADATHRARSLFGPGTKCDEVNCAVLQLVFYPGGSVPVEDIRLVCTFSGAIMDLSVPPGVTYLEYDGTPIDNPRERAIYRNNLKIKIDRLTPQSYVSPIVLLHGDSVTPSVDCGTYQGNFIARQVDRKDIPVWVASAFKPRT